MDPSSAPSVHDDQQVMTAQVAQQSPQHTGQLLEGETAGPDYARPGPTVRLPLPNGVSAAEVRRPPSDLVEMESLRGSPLAAGMSLAANGGAPSSSGLLTEAWPAQPGPERGERGVASTTARTPFSPATFSWVSRLGEFLRTQIPGVETRTTLTRQQVVAASGEVVSREQVQHTTSRPPSPQ